MLQISSLKDLRQFGVFALTGEADNLSYRILCDVSQSGKTLLKEVYDMDANTPPWNNETDGKKHVAAVMLSGRAWQDIAPIALLHCCHTVFETEFSYIGLQTKERLKQAKWALNEETDEYVMTVPPQYSDNEGEIWHRWPNSYGKIQRFFKHLDVPHQGTRNTHVMSGRTF